MIAAVLHEPKNILLEERDVPAPTAGEVLVRVRATGICGSDLSYYYKGKSGDFVLREPLILGHEVAGEISAIGPGVATLNPGDYVAVNPACACGGCHFCLKGMPNQCLQMRFMGSASTFPHQQGSFREYFVAPAAQCIRIPDDFSFAIASMAEPLAVTTHALRRAGNLLGARVLIVGCGPIGCMLVAGARRAGAHELAAVDVAESAVQMALQLGATEAVLTSDEGRMQQWESNRGHFDVVIEASGTPAGLNTALRSASAGGTIIQVGNMPAGESLMPVNLVMVKELRYLGSFRFTAEDYALAVQELAWNAIDLRPLMTHAFPLQQANQAFETARDRAQSMKVHLVFE